MDVPIFLKVGQKTLWPVTLITGSSYLKWLWQDVAGLSGGCSRSRLTYVSCLTSFKRQHHPCQYGPSTSPETESCLNTCTWFTCVSGATKCSPKNLLFVYVKNPWQSVKDLNCISLSVVVTWKYNYINFVPDKREKKKIKKKEGKKHSKKWRFTQ